MHRSALPGLVLEGAGLVSAPRDDSRRLERQADHAAPGADQEHSGVGRQTFCGWEDTLSAPQVFDVTAAMTPGEHTITVLVDNARLPPVGPSHAVDERTQTNWNGIIGKMELRATAPVWLDDVQVYPDVEKKQAVVRAVVGNITGKAASGQITVGCESYNVAKPSTFKTQSFEVKAPERENVVEFT